MATVEHHPSQGIDIAPHRLLRLVFPGVFSFPWYPSVWGRWLLLSLLAAPLVGLFAALYQHFFLVGLILPVTVILTVAWCVGAAAFCLTILRDTAAGNDEILNWPPDGWFDWISDAFYLLESLVVCIVAGSGLSWLLHARLPEEIVLSLACLVVLFPLTLLSMLENQSPLLPVSWPVWRSLVYRWSAWAVLYLGSLVLLAAVSGIAAACGVVGELLAGGSWWAASVTPLLGVAFAMIYFRLLGRLAWYCGQEPLDGLEEDEAWETGRLEEEETPAQAFDAKKPQS